MTLCELQLCHANKNYHSNRLAKLLYSNRSFLTGFHQFVQPSARWRHVSESVIVGVGSSAIRPYSTTGVPVISIFVKGGCCLKTNRVVCNLNSCSKLRPALPPVIPPRCNAKSNPCCAGPCPILPWHGFVRYCS